MGDIDGGQTQGNTRSGEKYGKGYAKDDIGQYHGKEGNGLHIAAHPETVPVYPDGAEASDHRRAERGAERYEYAVPKTAPKFPFCEKPAVPSEGKSGPPHADRFVKRIEYQNYEGHKKEYHGNYKNHLGKGKRLSYRPFRVTGRLAGSLSGFYGGDYITDHILEIHAITPRPVLPYR
jgi:hypothetical protein